MMNENNVNENAVPEKKLTDWENEPTVSDLSESVKDAQNEYDKHISDVDTWLSNMFVKDTKTEGNQSSVTPKVIRKHAEWRYSSLADPFLSTPDLFNVSPITAGDRARAMQNQLVLNNQFNTKIRKVPFIDSFVRDLVDIGTAVIKVGWESEEEEVTSMVPVYEYLPADSPELAQQYTQLIQLQMQNPEEYANHSTPGLDEALRILQEEGMLVIPQEVGEEEVVEIVEIKNQPTVEVYNHANLIIDPSCAGCVDNAEFICEKYKTSLSNLRKDGNYINLDAINIEGASPLASPDYEESKDNDSFNFTDKERKQFVVHTYWGTWDIDGSGMTKSIVASWVGDVFIRLEENPYPDHKPPFVLANYMPVRDSIYGEPDGELLTPNQDIIGAVTRGMIDLLGKSANSQTGIRKDMLDVTNQRKYKRGDDYEFNATVDPRQGFYTHVYPEIPQSAYSMLTLQNADAESLTGIKAFNSGISGEALGKTATGVRSALDATSKRELGILRRSAACIVEVGHKIISMNAVFLSEEEVVRVTDEQFVQIRRDDLAGHFDLRLTISTAAEDNQKAEELAFMLQTTGNSMDPDLHKMILSDIARLRKMPDLAQKIEDFQPQPDPLAQAKAQLEIELLKAQVAKEQSIAEKNQADAQVSLAQMGRETAQGQLNYAKSKSELEKAKNLASKTDRQDLDYMEQEMGVNQERDLQQLDRKNDHTKDQREQSSDLDMISKLAEGAMSGNSEM